MYKNGKNRGGGGGRTWVEMKEKKKVVLQSYLTNFHVYPFSNPLATLSSNTFILLIVTEVWFTLTHSKSGKLQK